MVYRITYTLQYEIRMLIEKKAFICLGESFKSL